MDLSDNIGDQEDENDQPSRWTLFRRSKILVAVTVLLAFVSDASTATMIQSLAPALIMANDYVKFSSVGHVSAPQGSWNSSDENSDEIIWETSPNAWNASYLTEGAYAFSVNATEFDNVYVAYNASANHGLIYMYCAWGTSSRILKCDKFDGLDLTPSIRNMTVNTSQPLPRVIFCKKETPRSQCVLDEALMVDISPIVGYLNAVGPLTQLIVTPFVGMICSKIGQRWPFAAGALLQIVGSLFFMFADSTGILFTGRIICGAASIVCLISGLMTTAAVFKNATERGKVLMYTFASSYPLGAMLSYLAGNVGYSFLGPRLPFGILLGLSVLDGFFRIIIDTKFYEKNVIKDGTAGKELVTPLRGSDHLERCTSEDEGSRGPEPSEYSPALKKTRKEGLISYFTNGYMMTTLLLITIQSYVFFSVCATAPNWLSNVLEAKQWELGIVFGVASAVHLVANVISGILVKKQTTWIFILFGCFSLTLSLVVYPLCPNIWFSLIPECLLRASDGLVIGMASNFVSLVTEVLFDGESAKAFSLLTAATTLGNTFGPFFSGLILQHISLMVLYLSMGAVVFVIGFGAFYLRTLPM